MSTLSPERARELMLKMRDAAAGTTGREMHVCVNSGELEDLLAHFALDARPADGISGLAASLIAATRRDTLTWADRIAIGEAVGCLQRLGHIGDCEVLPRATRAAGDLKRHLGETSEN